MSIESGEGRGERLIAYKTKEVKVPKILEEKGWKGNAYVEAVTSPTGGFEVCIRGEFEEGTDPLDRLPTPHPCTTFGEAQEEAERMINDIENWDSYN